MSLQKLIEKHKKAMIQAFKDSETGFSHLRLDPQEYAAILEAAEVMRDALCGYHDNCSYLGYGFCPKCGTHVNHKALDKCDKICEE